jgi:hypothetical protein
MFDRTRLSRLITLALASCAVTWAFAAGAMARPADGPTATAGPAPVYKAVPGDTDKAPNASRPPAFKGIVVDTNKVPDRAVVDHNLAGVGRGVRANPNAPVVTSTDDTGTIALVTAIVAMMIALGVIAFVATRPQPPVLRA